MKLVYSPKYEVDIGAHVFPTLKYRLIREELLKEGIVKEQDFILAEPAGDEEILLVHTPEYVLKLKTAALSPAEIYKLELPYSAQLVEAAWICAGGTVQACRLAIKQKIGMHIGGGFHHAFSDHGEGFCVLNDIAVAIRALQKDKTIKKALVVDCDLHQGNGTAAIFINDRSVYTFSIHQRDNYPFPKMPSDMDINLEDGTSDKEYLKHLQLNVPAIIDNFQPDLTIYVAGSDPYQYDQLGGLNLTMEGLKRRDEFMMRMCLEKGIPVAVVLAGGYAINTDDTVKIHCHTVKVALKNYKASS
ncbi:MAG: histone deacetylase [bacterium]